MILFVIIEHGAPSITSTPILQEDLFNQERRYLILLSSMAAILKYI